MPGCEQPTITIRPCGVLIAIEISFISFVLMYYDLRARKEAYDARLLAEELRQ